MSFSQNSFQEPLRTVVRFSKYSFPKKCYIEDRKQGTKNTQAVQVKNIYNITLFQAFKIFYYIENIRKQFTLYSADAYSGV